jgi:flavin reductase (DIM6/NTAB) family NADH-FMN oxidoreductase RutF
MRNANLHLIGEANSNSEENQFRSVVHRLAGGVSIITAGSGKHIAGLTVTSLSTLSSTPPRLMVSLDRTTSVFALIERYRLFGISVLDSDQQALATRFSQAGSERNQRFEEIEWLLATSGVPLLRRSLATIECEVEEIIERHSQGIVVGRLLGFNLSSRLSSLVYWNGDYIEIGRNRDLDVLAEVSIPLKHAGKSYLPRGRASKV